MPVFVAVTVTMNDSNIHVHVIMNEHTYSRHHSLWLRLSSVHKHRILRLNCNHTLEILCFASTSMPRWRGLGDKQTFTPTHKQRCEVSFNARSPFFRHARCTWQEAGQ